MTFRAPLPGSLIGTGSVRSAQTEGRTPDATMVRPVLQTPRPAFEREIGSARRIAAGEGHRVGEGRDRGEAAEFRPAQVREGPAHQERTAGDGLRGRDRKSTRLNSSHSQISYAVFCLK